MNRYRPHIYVIPEDDANRQVAGGFLLHNAVHQSHIRVVPPAGGWSKVFDVFQDEYVRILNRWQEAHVLLLIDFDNDFRARKAHFDQSVPVEFHSRVFILGAPDTPEELKRTLGAGSLEEIGGRLANDCFAESTQNWDQIELQHNASERDRLTQIVKPFLISPRCP